MEDIQHDGSEAGAQMVKARGLETASPHPLQAQAGYEGKKGPTERVPPEIITMIFKFNMPEDTVLYNLSVVPSTAKLKYALSAPLALSAICQRWRDIARATPQLWTHVPLRPGSANAHSLPGLAEDWLRLSGSRLPLSIDVYVEIEEVGVEDLQKLVQVISPYCARWSHVIYRGFYANLANILNNGADLGQLKSLRLAMAFEVEEWRRYDNLASKLQNLSVGYKPPKDRRP
ncbi:hypothetical protein BDN70DRAFT_963222 [Pholiota conissans]|uniref:F-box domain-containing protein n=1 Tax=Pholiota conissans TaxID=109636 RepID=A0A9P6D459_9AGAR|nr:hypothetical protein BDN70DRAFT_963222 [Pholiota conissans]